VVVSGGGDGGGWYSPGCMVGLRVVGLGAVAVCFPHVLQV